MESIKSTYLIEPKFVEEGVVYPALVVGHALTPRVLEETEACGLSSLQIGDMITESLGAPTVVVSSLPVAVPTLNHRVLEELCIAGSSKVMEEESLESGDTFAITASTGDIFTSTFDKDPYTLADARMVEAVKWVVVEDARHALEKVVRSSNITIFAPNNVFWEKNLDLEFRRFLRELGNLKSLQKLLQFHVVPMRIVAEE
ncbi:hypothetical protein SUGI_1117790 [Cryptomeria japonica]|nr:hypothetical protein SUGI_1117790 [Cryptomeria japonica]